MLFEGKPEGANLTQSFAISNNGTFTVSDGSGNSYSIGPPTGLPAGTTFTSLRTNSTTAIVTFLDLSSNSISSNVTEVYSVNKQFCYPSGLRIDVIGNTNWGLSLTGEISLPFKSSPINITSTRAYFGMSHGIELGIDWSDSLQSNPIFNRSGNSLTYPVQSQYSIDPVTGGGGGSAARQLV